MSLTALLTNLTPSDPNFLDQYTVFSDNDILILNKPAGLLSIPGKGQALADSVISRLQNICSNILLVHRLDRDTSGLMVFAFNKAAQRHLSTQFQQRQVEKAYTALVMGHIAPAIAERGQINLPVRYDETRPPLHVVDIDYPKPALTYFDVIDYSSLPDKDHVQHPVTRVNLKPVTGRAHQLRVHMQAIGHAIVGDTLYASAVGQCLATRLCLHATRLAFQHPQQDRTVEFEIDVPF